MDVLGLAIVKASKVTNNLSPLITVRYEPGCFDSVDRLYVVSVWFGLITNCEVASFVELAEVQEVFWLNFRTDLRLYTSGNPRDQGPVLPTGLGAEYSIVLVVRLVAALEVRVRRVLLVTDETVPRRVGWDVLPVYRVYPGWTVALKYVLVPVTLAEVVTVVTVPIRLAYLAVSMATTRFWFTVFVVAELAGASTSYTIEAVNAVFSVVPLALISVMVMVLDADITRLAYLLGKLIGIPAG